ncbi:MAG TPA: GNAT family N-acetyltransferase [Jatrophihabitans sp.]|jgi:GNAT superfamily N-acetyltransferase|nr:GNAT family N-acetyltransferase [Jatrophihabitans sp.]
MALPPGYPTAYEITRRLADGRRVQIRPILPSDGPELARAIQSADAATLRSRFLGAAPHVNGRLLDSLTRLDYTTRFALVARARGRGIAVARYAALPPYPDGKVAAELAIVVDPAWRRAGLATLLVALLSQRAHECGIDRFTAIFFSQNRPVVELARAVRARVTVTNGTSQLEIALGDAPIAGGIEAAS